MQQASVLKSGRHIHILGWEAIRDRRAAVCCGVPIKGHVCLQSAGPPAAERSTAWGRRAQGQQEALAARRRLHDASLLYILHANSKFLKRYPNPSSNT